MMKGDYFDNVTLNAPSKKNPILGVVAPIGAFTPTRPIFSIYARKKRLTFDSLFIDIQNPTHSTGRCILLNWIVKECTYLVYIFMDFERGYTNRKHTENTSTWGMASG